ncbi:VWA-like domain-containing protein [Bacillus solitudinis]|uniref:VWA-like domain-containing protein n=1 Tax=Bacillus solitudinis TaxID=2014074 RepID=UPI000C2448C8|nr:VWA-like domain-containing protein [Bacillus solitudinis]
MKWQKSLLSMIQKQEGKIVLAIDTSTNDTEALIESIVKLFKEVKPETTLVQSDFKIRDISPIEKPNIHYFTHGKSSYTEVLEWGNENKIDTLFYITDVTGYFYENILIDYEVVWLVPNDFIPKVPFGKTLKIA